ncbi:MAG: FecR domain-containing protein [Spirochaetales bacterium]|nr:FecR domain-containing protein [Spirochaetales bacterium]
MKKVSILICLMILTVVACSRERESAGVASVEPPEVKTPAAEVVYLEGNVTIDGEQAEIGDVIGMTPVIETGSYSLCEIIFRERNILRVGPDTIASIVFSEVIQSVDLQKGSLTSVLKNLAGKADEDSFIVTSPSGSAGVRGTSFYIRVSDDGKETYICDCNGRLHIADSEGGKEELLEASHHLARIITCNGGVCTLEPGKMLYHTDEDIETLAAKIDWTVDWSVIEE